MTQTRTEDFDRAGADAIRLTYAEPDGVVRGGIVVLHTVVRHEADDVTDSVRQLVSGLAGEGWLAAAPHVDDAGGELSGDDVLDATDGTLEWLTERGVDSDQLGVVGFDIGGTAALVVASNRRLGAAVSIGKAGTGEPTDIAGSLASPWLGIYGDGEDVERLRDAAAQSKVATNVVHFPGDNFDEGSDAAEEAWQRTLSWFDAHLR